MFNYRTFFSFVVLISWFFTMHPSIKEFQQTQNDFAVLREKYLNKKADQAEKIGMIPVQGTQASFEELNKLRSKLNKALTKVRLNSDDIRDIRITIGLLETANSPRWPRAQDYRELLEAKLKKQELMAKSPRRVILRESKLHNEQGTKAQSPKNDMPVAKPTDLEVKKESSMQWTHEHEKVAALFQPRVLITRENLKQCTLWINNAQLNWQAKNKDHKTLEQLARECDEFFRETNDGMSASEVFESEWAAFMKALQRKVD